MRLIDKQAVIESLNRIPRINGIGMELLIAVPDVEEMIAGLPTVDAIPIEPLAVWLAGYHVSPPEYALKETGAYDEIDPQSVVYTPNQIATAWAYHLRKLMESGLMDG